MTTSTTYYMNGKLMKKESWINGKWIEEEGEKVWSTDDPYWGGTIGYPMDIKPLTKQEISEKAAKFWDDWGAKLANAYEPEPVCFMTVEI